MVVEQPMMMCSEHQMPLLYRGTQCPWCEFINSMKVELEKEYKRGFTDGVEAAESEALNAKRSDAGEEQAPTD